MFSEGTKEKVWFGGGSADLSSSRRRGSGTRAGGSERGGDSARETVVYWACTVPAPSHANSCYRTKGGCFPTSITAQGDLNRSKGLSVEEVPQCLESQVN